jgi:hypothetical protein
MGLLDKVKAGAGDIASKAMEDAGDLAAKAKETAKELQLKRDLAKAHEELGQKAYSLVDSGAITHAELDRHVARIRDLNGQIAALKEADDASGSGGEPSAGDRDENSPAT